MRLLALLLVMPIFAACEFGRVAGPATALPAPSALAASPCTAGVCAVPVAPVALAAPVGAYGVRYEIGAQEHARAALSIPPAVAGCLVTAASKILLDAIAGVECALQNLVPNPQPALHLVEFAPAAKAAALPCAPPAAAAPCGR